MQETAVCSVQGAPCSSKRVAIDGLCRFRWDRKACDLLMSLPSRAAGVGHPVNPVSLMSRARSESWRNDRPAGVTKVFQRHECFIEPTPHKCVSHLLSKDDWRLALRNERDKNG